MLDQFGSLKLRNNTAEEPAFMGMMQWRPLLITCHRCNHTSELMSSQMTHDSKCDYRKFK